VATQDPDAIWKPGYRGEVVYPVATAAGSAPRRRRRFAAVAIGVAMAAVTFGVLWSRFGHGDSAEPAARIPTSLRERWAVTLDRPVGAVTGTDHVIVAHAGGDLVLLDAGSGIERWRVPAPSAVGQLQVIDGVAVFHDMFGDASLAGFDLETGDQLWSRPLRHGPDVTLTGDSLVVPGFSAGGMVSSVEVVDPQTGQRRAAFEGEEVAMSATTIRRRVADVVEWYDRDTFQRRARIDLAALGLDRFQTEGAPTDAGLVIATYDRAWLIDADGSVVSSLELANKLNAPWSLDELDGSGRHVALQSVDATTMLTVSEGQLRELWTRPVAPVDWMMDHFRTIVTVRSHEGAEQVIDASTGRAIFSGRHPGLDGLTLASNGFIAGADPREDGSWTIVGYDFDGTELWRLPVPELGWPALIPGALLTIDNDAQDRAATLTLLS
jgi:outer membrane protein assembly factor BamB